MVYNIEAVLFVAVTILGIAESFLSGYCGNLEEGERLPWLAALQYNTPDGPKTGCGGVLISSRYVLTAAHCIHGKYNPEKWVLDKVRIGNWEKLDDDDCSNSHPGVGSEYQRVCVGVEHYITHDDYAVFSNDQRHDIALIKLSEDVYKIQPICLPSVDNIHYELRAGGWGFQQAKKLFNWKSRANMTRLDIDHCFVSYYNRGVTIDKRAQVCARSLTQRDMCTGDSGGPLMEVKPWKSDEYDEKWTVVGVMAFGPNCYNNTGSLPIVYNKVHDYVPWILVNAK